MELRDILAVLRIRWRTVVITSSLVLVAALAYSLTAPPVYVARSRLFLAVSVGQSSGQLSRGFAYTQNLAVLYSRVATEPVVLEPVAEQLGLGVTAAQLSGSVVARTPRDTVLIEIEVSQSDPHRAARIADAVARQLTTAVGDLLPASVADGAPPAANGTVAVRLTTIAPAAVPSAPAGPRVGLNAVIGLLAGLALGGAVALLRDVASGRIDRGVVARMAQAPVIATLTGSRDSRAGRREHGDEVLQLRAGVEHLRTTRGLRTLVFASAFDDDAAAPVVFELAHALAQAGIRPLLVDADLRRPDLDRRCGRAATVGLSSVLQGEAAWGDVVVQLGWDLPDLLPAGPPPENLGSALRGEALKELLNQAAGSYDVVLVRAPAAARVADGLLLAATADGTVLVVDRRSSRRDALRECMDNLKLASAQVVGVVLV